MSELNAPKGLRSYLERHEDDIAIELDDFGDLRETFILEFGHEPREYQYRRKPDDKA